MAKNPFNFKAVSAGWVERRPLRPASLDFIYCFYDGPLRGKKLSRREPGPEIYEQAGLRYKRQDVVKSEVTGSWLFYYSFVPDSTAEIDFLATQVPGFQ